MWKNKRATYTVLFDAQPLVGRRTGIGHYVEALVERLAAQNPHVTFIGHYYQAPTGTPHLKNLSNISFRKTKFITVRLRNLLRRLGIILPIEIMAWRKADILLFTDYIGTPSPFRTPIVAIAYDFSFLDLPEFVSTRNRKDLQRFCLPTLKRASYILCISDFTKNRLFFHFPKIKARVIVTPIPPHQKKSTTPVAISERLHSLGIISRKYILYLGTIEPRKNIARLVDAYTKLPRKTWETYSLVLAGGKGWRDEEILTAIHNAQANGNNIILTGYITDEERTALYQNAACFVLPSHYEGFGMPVLEAMRYDIPVALSDIPVFHEVAQDAAIYFDKDSSFDIAEKLAALLENTDLHRQLVGSGHRRLDAFSWKTNTQTVIKAFEKLGRQ